jgi:hypothetical protein
VASLHFFKSAQEKFFNLHWNQRGASSVKENLFKFLKGPILVNEVEVLFHKAVFFYLNKVLDKAAEIGLQVVNKLFHRVLALVHHV